MNAESLRVVLVSPRNPLNIGAAARAMSNFGFGTLRLVRPYDLAFHEARSAVRAKHVLESARVFSSIAEAVADCGLVVGTTAVGHRDLHAPLYPLEAAAQRILERVTGVALLFGSEKFGLSNEDLSHCHFLLRIPTREEHGSMNLGQAVAVCLYELRRSLDREVVRFPGPELASAGDEERITEMLIQLLETSGYLNPSTRESSELKIRRLVRRLSIPANDAETWTGIFRQIVWKLQKL